MTDYDLNKPQVIELSKELKEISGIVFMDNSTYVITDNTGQLFKLDMAKGKILAQWKFGKTDDYEDVAVANNKFYILNSNGNIISFDAPGAEINVTKEFGISFRQRE